MNRDLAPAIQREKQSVTELEGFINQLLWRKRLVRIGTTRSGGQLLAPRPNASGYNFDVMLAKAIETKPVGGGENFAVSANLFIAMPVGPCCDVGVKPFAVFDNGSEEGQFAARPSLGQPT